MRVGRWGEQTMWPKTTPVFCSVLSAQRGWIVWLGGLRSEPRAWQRPSPCAGLRCCLPHTGAVADGAQLPLCCPSVAPPLPFAPAYCAFTCPRAGPVPIQVGVAVLACMAGSAGMMSMLKKPLPKTATPEWRAAAKTLPNPLRDPTGAVRAKCLFLFLQPCLADWLMSARVQIIRVCLAALVRVGIDMTAVCS